MNRCREASAFLANDSSPSGNPLTAVLVAGPQHGTLVLEPDGGFDHTPSRGFVGTDTFQYKANDGTADSNVATVTINVIPFSHAPVGTSSTISVPAGPTYAISAADFGFTDPNDTPPNIFAAVEITTLPTSANLTLAGVPVTAGQFVSVADLNAGNLVLSPATGSPHISFTFQVEDSGSTVNGGANLDPTPKTLTFNSPPVAQDDSYSVNENDTLDQAFLGNHLRITVPGLSLVGGPRPRIPLTWTATPVACNVTVNGNSITFAYPPASGNGSGGIITLPGGQFGSNGDDALTFVAPNNQPLVPGTYTGTKQSADADSPGLSIVFNGYLEGGIGLTGQFTVIEAVYGPGGTLSDSTPPSNNSWAAARSAADCSTTPRQGWGRASCKTIPMPTAIRSPPFWSPVRNMAG